MYVSHELVCGLTTYVHRNCKPRPSLHTFQILVIISNYFYKKKLLSSIYGEIRLKGKCSWKFDRRQARDSPWDTYHLLGQGLVYPVRLWSLRRSTAG